jgi:hypothetical protein
MNEDGYVPLEKAELDENHHAPAYTKGLVSLTGAELLARKFPPREFILDPWLPSQGLAMLFAERGVGKTWVAMNIAHAVAGGGDFLGWCAPSPKRVVYFDGEMPAALIQERYASIVASSSVEAPEDNFRIVSAELQRDGLPDLADAASQRFYDDAIQDADLVIIDNLSTTCRSLKENDADSWSPVQVWNLRQRAAGRSVLLVHHAGKSGLQRGSSRKDDVLDTIVRLCRPSGYSAQEGARFEVHYDKARGLFGVEATPFEARLEGGVWSKGEISRDADDMALRMHQKDGKSIRQIAEITGIPKTTVERRLRGSANDPS